VKKASHADDAQDVANESRSPSALAWAAYVREYRRCAADVPVERPRTLGALVRGEYPMSLPGDAQRADLFARLIDDLVPLAHTGLNAAGLIQRSIDHAAEVIEELRRRDAGLARGPAARSERAAKIAQHGRDAGSVYRKAALDYAIVHPDARRDEVVTYLQRQSSLPSRSAATIRRYVAGAIGDAKELRSKGKK
jgi:hypothetical protein